MCSEAHSRDSLIDGAVASVYIWSIPPLLFERGIRGRFMGVGKNGLKMVIWLSGGFLVPLS